MNFKKKLLVKIFHTNEKWCCYITVDSAMAASQNGFCSYKFSSIHKKTNIMQIKDIVQPKKRGVKRGINRFISTSHTIADAFFLLNLKETFSAFRAQKMWSPFLCDVRCAVECCDAAPPLLVWQDAPAILFIY
jgi:hypothetical protein